MAPEGLAFEPILEEIESAVVVNSGFRDPIQVVGVNLVPGERTVFDTDSMLTWNFGMFAVRFVDTAVDASAVFEVQLGETDDEEVISVPVHLIANEWSWLSHGAPVFPSHETCFTVSETGSRVVSIEIVGAGLVLPKWFAVLYEVSDTKNFLYYHHDCFRYLTRMVLAIKPRSPLRCRALRVAWVARVVSVQSVKCQQER